MSNVCRNCGTLHYRGGGRYCIYCNRDQDAHWKNDIYNCCDITSDEGLPVVVAPQYSWKNPSGCEVETVHPVNAYAPDSQQARNINPNLEKVTIETPVKKFQIQDFNICGFYLHTVGSGIVGIKCFDALGNLVYEAVTSTRLWGTDVLVPLGLGVPGGSKDWLATNVAKIVLDPFPDGTILDVYGMGAYEFHCPVKPVPAVCGVGVANAFVVSDEDYMDARAGNTLIDMNYQKWAILVDETELGADWIASGTVLFPKGWKADPENVGETDLRGVATNCTLVPGFYSIQNTQLYRFDLHRIVFAIDNYDASDSTFTLKFPNRDNDFEMYPVSIPSTFGRQYICFYSNYNGIPGSLWGSNVTTAFSSLLPDCTGARFTIDFDVNKLSVVGMEWFYVDSESKTTRCPLPVMSCSINKRRKIGDHPPELIYYDNTISSEPYSPINFPISNLKHGYDMLDAVVLTTASRYPDAAGVSPYEFFDERERESKHIYAFKVGTSAVIVSDQEYDCYGVYVYFRTSTRFDVGQINAHFVLTWSDPYDREQTLSFNLEGVDNDAVYYKRSLYNPGTPFDASIGEPFIRNFSEFSITRDPTGSEWDNLDIPIVCVQLDLLPSNCPGQKPSKPTTECSRFCEYPESTPEFDITKGLRGNQFVRDDTVFQTCPWQIPDGWHSNPWYIDTFAIDEIVPAKFNSSDALYETSFGVELSKYDLSESIFLDASNGNRPYGLDLIACQSDQTISFKLGRSDGGPSSRPNVHTTPYTIGAITLWMPDNPKVVAAGDHRYADIFGLGLHFGWANKSPWENYATVRLKVTFYPGEAPGQIVPFPSGWDTGTSPTLKEVMTKTYWLDLAHPFIANLSTPDTDPLDEWWWLMPQDNPKGEKVPLGRLVEKIVIEVIDSGPQAGSYELDEILVLGDISCPPDAVVVPGIENPSPDPGPALYSCAVETPLVNGQIFTDTATVQLNAEQSSSNATLVQQMTLQHKWPDTVLSDLRLAVLSDFSSLTMEYSSPTNSRSPWALHAVVGSASFFYCYLRTHLLVLSSPLDFFRMDTYFRGGSNGGWTCSFYYDEKGSDLICTYSGNIAGSNTSTAFVSNYNTSTNTGNPFARNVKSIRFDFSTNSDAILRIASISAYVRDPVTSRLSIINTPTYSPYVESTLQLLNPSLVQDYDVISTSRYEWQRSKPTYSNNSIMVSSFPTLRSYARRLDVSDIANLYENGVTPSWSSGTTNLIKELLSGTAADAQYVSITTRPTFGVELASAKDFYLAQIRWILYNGYGDSWSINFYDVKNGNLIRSITDHSTPGDPNTGWSAYFTGLLPDVTAVYDYWDEPLARNCKYFEIVTSGLNTLYINYNGFKNFDFIIAEPGTQLPFIKPDASILFNAQPIRLEKRLLKITWTSPCDLYRLDWITQDLSGKSLPLVCYGDDISTSIMLSSQIQTQAGLNEYSLYSSYGTAIPYGYAIARAVLSMVLDASSVTNHLSFFALHGYCKPDSVCPTVPTTGINPIEVGGPYSCKHDTPIHTVQYAPYEKDVFELGYNDFVLSTRYAALAPLRVIDSYLEVQPIDVILPGIGTASQTGTYFFHSINGIDVTNQAVLINFTAPFDIYFHKIVLFSNSWPDTAEVIVDFINPTGTPIPTYTLKLTDGSPSDSKTRISTLFTQFAPGTPIHDVRKNPISRGTTTIQLTFTGFTDPVLVKEYNLYIMDSFCGTRGPPITTNPIPIVDPLPPYEIIDPPTTNPIPVVPPVTGKPWLTLIPPSGSWSIVAPSYVPPCIDTPLLNPDGTLSNAGKYKSPTFSPPYPLIDSYYLWHGYALNQYTVAMLADLSYVAMGVLITTNSGSVSNPYAIFEHGVQYTKQLTLQSNEWIELEWPSLVSINFMNMHTMPKYQKDSGPINISIIDNNENTILPPLGNASPYTFALGVTPTTNPSRVYQCNYWNEQVVQSRIGIRDAANHIDFSRAFVNVKKVRFTGPFTYLNSFEIFGIFQNGTVV